MAMLKNTRKSARFILTEKREIKQNEMKNNTYINFIKEMNSIFMVL